jgi:nucleotide-binding universal stress UspA family protein
MPKKILVAYDGSEPADKAYAFALDLAKHYAAPLLVLSVARPPEPPEDVETEAMLENAEQHYKERFEAMRRQAEAQGLKPEFRVVVGHPAEQIIYAAEKEGVDHIVLGHRGKSFFERWRMGSVSKQVMNYAHCAVTVVR